MPPTQGGCNSETKVLLVEGNEDRKEKRRRLASMSLEREATAPTSTRKMASTWSKLLGGKLEKEIRRLKDEIEGCDQKIAELDEKMKLIVAQHEQELGVLRKELQEIREQL